MLLTTGEGSRACEARDRLAAERAGISFVMFRDGDGRQRIVALDRAAAPMSVGRGAAADVCLAWDHEISRVHAQLDCVGDAWTLVDDGLSRNGTFVNGERVHARRRLTDGDVICVGGTELTYCAPTPDSDETSVADAAPAVRLTDNQRRVLVALCRPYRDATPFATPATNQQIANEVFLGVDAVKTHLRALFGKFAVGDLPHNHKRARLVELALQSGAISARELAD